MVEVNIPRVKGKMAEKGYNMTTLANELKISRSTMKTYLDMPCKMPYHIIAQMATLLCDDTTEAKDIFFADNLRGA